MGKYSESFWEIEVSEGFSPIPFTEVFHEYATYRYHLCC